MRVEKWELMSKRHCVGAKNRGVASGSLWKVESIQGRSESSKKSKIN